MSAEGLRRGADAENVSAGYPSFDRALVGWQHSPGHNANLLYRPIRRIGIAASSAPGTRYKTFWALVMTD
ncbi:MAG: CAP domain-containing protein [Janthinobacterium lividum]